MDACRTIHWNSKANEDGKKLLKEKKEWDKKRDKKGSSLEEENPMREPLKTVAEELQEYFKENKEEENKETFNKKHTEWCERLIKDYSSYLDEKLTYGQAQKIINMAFKYLYCIFDAKEKLEEKKERFKYCHMPLDKFSLEWVKRYFKKGSVKSWSHMEKEDLENKEYGYNTYLKNIEEYCEQKYDGQISPLQLDFIVWPKMQKIMATEEFIKTFEEDDDKWVQKAIGCEKYDILQSLSLMRKGKERILSVNVNMVKVEVQDVRQLSMNISIKTVSRYLLIIDIIRIRWCITRCTMRLKNMELKIM